MKFVKTTLLFSLITIFSMAPAHAKESPVVLFETNVGNFEVTLNPEKAPITVKNFLSLVHA